MYYIIIIILLLLSLELNRRFYTNYVSPPKYKTKYYPTHLYKTGDLIFFRSLDSNHMYLSDSYFSHVGIVIINDDIPYILELTNPELKFSPLKERFCQYFNGTIYIKPIKYKISNLQKQLIPNIIKWSHTVKYPENKYKFIEFILSNCGSQNNTYNTQICTTFIIQVLNKLKILKGDEVIGCNSIEFLKKLKKVNNNEYDDIYMLTTTNNNKTYYI